MMPYWFCMGDVWAPAPERLGLRDNEIHVWRAWLDLTPADFESVANALTPDEQARAARFISPRHGRRFSAARGVLREILSRYLDRNPSQLQFCYGPSGKPALAPGSGMDELRFNLSHSHGLALYAVTRAREVGVDVERIQPQLAEEQIAERFFSPGEVAELRALPPSVQAEAFFNCWTRKEAYIKARGEGMAIPLNSFDVSLAPGAPAALLSVRRDLEECARWSLRAVASSAGYAAAIAAEGNDWRLQLWEWRRRAM